MYFPAFCIFERPKKATQILCDATYDGLTRLFSALKTNRIFLEHFRFGNLVYTIFMDRIYRDFLKSNWRKGKGQSPTE